MFDNMSPKFGDAVELRHKCSCIIQVCMTGHCTYHKGMVGATNMNAQSSRSHAIFTITVECSDKGPDGAVRVRAGKLHLVDLAVSDG